VAQRVNSFSSSRNFLRVLIYPLLETILCCPPWHLPSRPDCAPVDLPTLGKTFK
jgi:hypothetical protein